MANRNDVATSSSTCGCKIGRMADQYELDRLDDDLVAYWTGDADEQYSTRALATVVNQRILEAALKQADISFKEGEIENTYRLLTDDDVSSGVQVETENELERDGVAVDQVKSDFVSHQTVYNHLTDCLDASLDSPSDEERLEQSGEKLGALQNRTAAVTTDTIERLDNNDIIDIGGFNVVVSATVTCEECFQEYTVRELLDNGSCNCDSDSERR
ncbi:rod-determining factor RdfA [Natrinema ejinorense]|uniref:Uncharacterized protein n=1 Tax=Natrinema ejinorense TaxID=373386 RepID=A0A2A5QPP9_9EURY|nr:rod-determining factor RdfA [Natrinema ejinorense]PCR88821.1 hypothetical protein CP557_20285 [Natrinema ejinorense]